MPKKAPTPPPADVLAQLQRELTPETLRWVTAFAERACARLLALEGRDDPAYIPTMVQDAIGDTYAGIRTWDPARKSLRYHLGRVIQSRACHDLERARRRRHVSFHEVTDSRDENDVAVEMSIRVEDERTRPDSRLAIVEGRALVYDALRVLAAADPEVIALLDAYQAGDLRRDEAMSRLSWTLPRHVNVRRRLETLVQHVPPEVRATALEILTRDGGVPPATVVRGAAFVQRGTACLDASGEAHGEASNDQVASDSADQALSATGDGWASE